MGTAKWLNKGWEHHHKAVKEEKDAWSRKQSRFWLKISEGDEPGKDIIFLDDEPTMIKEHTLTKKIDGKWQYFGNYTCRAGVFEDDLSCLMCDNGIKTASIGFFTVIECTTFTTEDGKEIKNPRRLYAAKTKMRKAIEYRKGQRGSLVGCKFHVRRTDKKDAREGGDIEFVEEVATDMVDGRMTITDKNYWWTDKDGDDHAPSVFDYEKILMPVSNTDMSVALRKQTKASNPDVFDQAIENRKKSQNPESFI